MLAAVAAAMIFAFLTLTLTSNQVATGLALTIFGVGLSSLIGEGFVGRPSRVFGPVFPAASRGIRCCGWSSATIRSSMCRSP